MAVKLASSPFGSASRTRALLALRLLAESYPRELARLLRASLSAVQKGLSSLEADGLVVGRRVGRTRLYRLNPRYFALAQLELYLDRLVEADDAL